MIVVGVTYQVKASQIIDLLCDSERADQIGLLSQLFSSDPSKELCFSVEMRARSLDWSFIDQLWGSVCSLSSNSYPGHTKDT